MPSMGFSQNEKSVERTIFDYCYFKATDFAYIIYPDSEGIQRLTTMYFLGPKVTVFTVVRDPVYYEKITKAYPSLFIAQNYWYYPSAYRILNNNKVLVDWTTVVSSTSKTKDTAWERVKKIPENVSDKKFQLINYEETNVYGNYKIAIPIIKTKVFEANLEIGDSLSIEFKSRNPKIKNHTISFSRPKIIPKIGYAHIDNEIDSALFYSLGYIPKIYSANNSIENENEIRLPSGAKKMIIQFRNQLEVKDSTLEYFLGNRPPSNSDWKKTGHTIIINDLIANDSLYIRYISQPENASIYRIVIPPKWYQTDMAKYLTAIILIAIILSTLFFLRLQNLKKKIKKKTEENEKNELKMRSIRSQLNPHFVFNALNSIQGLVNANEKEKANQYLSDFSNMMRDTLSGNSKDYSPLETELAILDRYLKLEQLRFGFGYEIKVSDSINATSIEIPTLLLQPLVENAVKHGVAQLLSKGKIAIEINKSGKDLIVAIKDSGPGFIEAQENKEGFGIRLTRERIQLINQINKENSISLAFNKTIEAMTAEVIFKDLL